MQLFTDRSRDQAKSGTPLSVSGKKTKGDPQGGRWETVFSGFGLGGVRYCRFGSVGWVVSKSLQSIGMDTRGQQYLPCISVYCVNCFPSSLVKLVSCCLVLLSLVSKCLLFATFSWLVDPVVLGSLRYFGFWWGCPSRRMGRWCLLGTCLIFGIRITVRDGTLILLE